MSCSAGRSDFRFSALLLPMPILRAASCWARGQLLERAFIAMYFEPSAIYTFRVHSRRDRGELAQAAAKSERTGKPARCFKDFVWRTRSSWSRQRRVVAKAEGTQGESFEARVERANSKTLNSG
jgi:hypothetical protein